MDIKKREFLAGSALIGTGLAAATQAQAQTQSAPTHTMLDSPITSLPAVMLALDAIERHLGSTRFVIAGLCRGADLAWKVALHDQRVIGMLQIDGLARAGPWFHLAQVRHHLRWPPTQWLKTASRLVSRYLRREPRPMEDLDIDREWPAVGASLIGPAGPKGDTGSV